jgi:hypothetical protein
MLEHQGEPYALLDLDYLSWAATGTDDRTTEFGLMLQNHGGSGELPASRHPAAGQ